jgi:chromosome segregation ATPase
VGFCVYQGDYHKQLIAELRSQVTIAAEVPHLRGEIERLVAETRQLKLDADSATRRADAERDAVARKDAIIERLQLEKAAIEAAVSTLQVESKQLRDQAAAVNTKLQEASVKSAIVDVLNSRIAELKSQLDTAQRSKETHQAQLEAATREVWRLRVMVALSAHSDLILAVR